MQNLFETNTDNKRMASKEPIPCVSTSLWKILEQNGWDVSGRTYLGFPSTRLAVTHGKEE
jgi:hypothetical protein